MEIVINISDEYAEQFYLNKCKDKFDSLATNEFGYVLRKAFEDAKPLPEHHGRLIECEPIYDKLIRSYRADKKDYPEIGKDYRVGLSNAIDLLIKAPTIIEGSDTE